MPLVLELFGGFRLFDGERNAVRVPDRRARALIAYLALAERAVPRHALAEVLCAGGDEQDQRSLLRQAVYGARKATAEPDLIVSVEDQIGLNDAVLASDVRAFQAAIARGDPASLSAAIELYHGPLLAGERSPSGAFEDWLSGRRSELLEQAMSALLALAGHHEAADEHGRALALARRALTLDPLREDARRQVMRSLAALGQRAAALREYECGRQLLADELQVGPDDDTEMLRGAIARGKETPATAAISSGATADEAQLPLPDKPSIAVLPFENLSGDPKQERLADGLAEEIITDLSRFRDLFVIARNSTFFYKHKPADIRQIARDLGVQYVLEGSLRAQDGRVRVTAQLIDATTGNHVWSERYDRPLDDVFAIQGEVAQSIGASLPGQRGALALARRETARRKSPESLQAYDYYTLGMEIKHRFSKEDNARAQELFRKAIEIAPNCAYGYLGLAWTYDLEVDNAWGEGYEESMKSWFDVVQKAIALEPYDSEARFQLAYYCQYKGDIHRALAELEHSLALNPNNADILALAAFILVRSGQPARALELVERAIRLNPHHPDWYYAPLRDACFHNRRFEDTIAATRKRIYPSPVWDPLFRALSYAQLGRGEEAVADVAEVLRLQPDFSAERFLSETGMYLGDEELELFLDSIAKAGLPVCASEAQLAKYPKLKRLEQCEVRRPSGFFAAPKRRRAAVVAAIGIAAVVAVGASWWYSARPQSAVTAGAAPAGAAVAEAALPLPDKPSIAVLPFENLAGDPKQERLAGGITEDVITDLARFRGLFVIARNSTEVYKGTTTDIRQIGRELGVQYVVEGSLQIDGDRVRITAQLIDATTGNYLWSARYDRPLDDVFAVQDEVAEQIVGALGGWWGRLAQAGRELAHRKPPKSLDAYDLYLLGIELKHRHTREDNQKAQEVLKKAIALDPEFAPPYAVLALSYLNDAAMGFGDDPARSLENMRAAAEKGVALDDADAMAHLVLAIGHFYDHQTAAGAKEFERALILGQNNADLLAIVAFNRPSKLPTGREDVENVKRAMRLNPHHPEWYLVTLGYAAYHGGLYDEAVGALQQVSSRTMLEAPLYLALSYAELGRQDEAAATVKELLAIEPDFSAERQIDGDVFRDRGIISHFIGSVRKAGLPICMTTQQLAKYPGVARLPQCEIQHAGG